MVTQKYHPTSVRMTAETRAGIERAARDDKRTMNSMIEKALSDWLAERGYLPSPAKPGPVGHLSRRSAPAAEPAPAQVAEPAGALPAPGNGGRPARRRQRAPTV